MTVHQQELPAAKPLGALEPVAHFDGAMPTGVTVSHQGRIFINFPEWGDEVGFTVAEIRDGRPVPYPDEATNRTDPDDPAAALVSVQSVVVDPADRLWILDTGSPMFRQTEYGGPKLVCVDLGTDRVTKTILFPRDVALPTSYLNDVRFDLRRGGAWETVAYDPRLLWPDTLSVATDGYLYVTANQLHRQASFQGGRDLRRKPYTLFRVRIDARPVLLR